MHVSHCDCRDAPLGELVLCCKRAKAETTPSIIRHLPVNPVTTIATTKTTKMRTTTTKTATSTKMPKPISGTTIPVCHNSLVEFSPYLAQNVPVVVKRVATGWPSTRLLSAIAGNVLASLLCCHCSQRPSRFLEIYFEKKNARTCVLMPPT